MVTKSFSASGPRGPMSGDVTSMMGEGNSTGYVPMQAGRCLENELILGLPPKMSSTILTRMEIRKPSDIHNRNTILKELITNFEAVERIQIP